MDNKFIVKSVIIERADVFTKVDNQPANAIAVYKIKDYLSYIIAGKNEFVVGDEVVFVKPDVILPTAEEHPIFEIYLTKLASNRRTRSIKFNFHLEGERADLYSEGILLGREKLKEYGYDFDTVSDEALGITKIDRDLAIEGNGNKTLEYDYLPLGIRKTDELNIKACYASLDFSRDLVITEKIDGNSVTVYAKDGEYGITTRNTVVNENSEDSRFYIAAKPYLDKLIAYHERTGRNIYIQGELYGEGVQSYKYNRYSKLKGHFIKWFNIIEFGFVKVLNHDAFNKEIVEVFGEPLEKLIVPELEIIPGGAIKDIHELLKYVTEKYFPMDENNLCMEGVVVRDKEDYTVSAKFLSSVYDSKK